MPAQAILPAAHQAHPLTHTHTVVTHTRWYAARGAVHTSITVPAAAVCRLSHTHAHTAQHTKRNDWLMCYCVSMWRGWSGPGGGAGAGSVGSMGMHGPCVLSPSTASTASTASAASCASSSVCGSERRTDWLVGWLVDRLID